MARDVRRKLAEHSAEGALHRGRAGLRRMREPAGSSGRTRGRFVRTGCGAGRVRRDELDGFSSRRLGEKSYGNR